jgi:hypothetical protein
MAPVVATGTGAAKPSDFSKVTVDTTVPPKEPPSLENAGLSED